MHDPSHDAPDPSQGDPSPSSYDDNEELELEPIDPDIIQHQRERTKRQSRQAEEAFDINAAYLQGDLGDPIDLEQLKKFRFTTRHLLIATAVLALLMTMTRRLGGCMGLFASGCIALAAGWWFVLREEQRRLEKLAARRKKIDRQIATQRAIEDGQPLPTGKVREFERASADVNADCDAENSALPPFRFSFSLREFLLSFTVAGIILGGSQILGFDNASLLLGLVALVGILVQAFGVELPPLIVLGWWLLLVLYIGISLWAVLVMPASI